MKKLLLVIASFFLFIGCVNAEIKTYDRTSLENYGVNKKWQIHDGNINNVLKTYAVDANDKVYDFANIITEQEELELKELIKNYYELRNDPGLFKLYQIYYDNENLQIHDAFTDCMVTKAEEFLGQIIFTPVPKRCQEIMQIKIDHIKPTKICRFQP